MNDTVAGFGIVTLAVMFLPTLIALFGARRFLPIVGVGALNILSVMMIWTIILAAIFWFVALFFAVGASNRTRRDNQHKEMMLLLRRQQGDRIRVEPDISSPTPQVGEVSWWLQRDRRK
jgi:amino acid transporter